MLNKLRCHAHFQFSANRIAWSGLLLQIQILNDKQCRSRSVGFFRSQLIWIYTVWKGKVYPGSAWQGLMRHQPVRVILRHLPKEKGEKGKKNQWRRGEIEEEDQGKREWQCSNRRNTNMSHFPPPAQSTVCHYHHHTTHLGQAVTYTSWSPVLKSLSCWTWIYAALANSVDPDQLAS